MLSHAIALALLRRMPPERAHGLALDGLRWGLGPGVGPPDDPILAQTLWGLPFASPVGLAAGFDKNAQAPAALARCGFGFVEVGTVTPRPQAGNPRPRLFRLTADRAVINRLGFNNDGHAAARANLEAAGSLSVPLIVNVGANRDSEDRLADYVAGIAAFARLADLFTINVSSPNTPGLRDLQAGAALDALLAAVMAAREKHTAGTPVLLKLAPDLDEAGLEEAAGVALRHRVDGIIMGNTTLARPEELESAERAEQGGLSGRPLFAPSTAKLRALYRLTRGAVPLVGVGGVESGETAYAKIRAGASLVQLYSAMVFHGPDLPRRIGDSLAGLLHRDGLRHVGEAVGAEA